MCCSVLADQPYPGVARKGPQPLAAPYSSIASNITPTVAAMYSMPPAVAVLQLALLAHTMTVPQHPALSTNPQEQQH